MGSSYLPRLTISYMLHCTFHNRKHVYFLRFVGRGKIPSGGQATNERIRAGGAKEGRKGNERRVCETLQMSFLLFTREGERVRGLARQLARSGAGDETPKGERRVARVFAQIFHLLRTCHRPQRSHAQAALTGSQMGCAIAS